MKNKSAVLLVLAFFTLVGVRAYAASGVRGAKAVVTVSQTTNTIGISSGPAVLYSVTLGTGAVTDFVTVLDSATVLGLTNVQALASFRMRLYPSSTTQNTVFSFDPPMQFKNGLMVIPATGLGSATFTWESGRITQGY